MTISSTTNRLQYTGNATTTDFSFGYVFFADTDLVVTLYDTTAEADVSPAPVLNGGATYDYTISGTYDFPTGEYPSGADVVFNTAPPSNYRITIERVVPQTQGVVLIDNSKFPANTVNGALDKLTVLVQRLAQLLDQSLQIPSSDPSTVSTLLPDAATRANKYLAFTASGDPSAADPASGGGVGDVIAAGNNPMSGNNTFSGSNTFSGINTHSGAESFSATVTFTGTLDADAATSVVVPTASGKNDNSKKAASTEYLATLLATIAGKSIWGLTWSNNAGDATNDIDIAAGGCMDGGGTYLMLMSALIKRSDAAWTVGTNQGALDSGAVGNNDYYIWAIARSDSGVTDILFSLSSTSPTMPANYDKKRLIGWFKRTGGSIVAFHTYASDGGSIDFAWDVPTLDINLAATLTTSRRTDAVKVPLNFSTIANLNVSLTDATEPNFWTWICCPDQTDAAPSGTLAPLAVASTEGGGGGSIWAGNLKVRTSAAGLIAARSTLATVDLYAVSTMGFHWSRQ